MNEIVKLEPTIFQLIKNYGIEYITPSISQIIHEAYLDAGYTNTTDEDKLLLIGRFTKEIQEFYGYLTGAEIRKAIHHGILGRYGDYMGINLKTLCKFLDKYLDSSERAQFVVNRNNALTINDASRLLPDRGTRNPDDELNTLKAMINSSYERWLRHIKGPTISGKSSIAKIYDYNGRIRYQLITDGLMTNDESLQQVYCRFYKDGKEKIYRL